MRWILDIQFRNFLEIIKMIFDENEEISLEEPVDWELLSKIARKQNLLPLFFEAASKIEDYVNNDVYTKDQPDVFSMVASQIQRNNAFMDIYGKITSQGIYPIVIKGIVCRQLYGDLGEHRPSGDEDILIKVKDFSKVKEILEQENYQCTLSSKTDHELTRYQEVSFFNREHNLCVEVHMDLIGNANEERARMNSFFQKVHEHSQTAQIYGMNVKVLEPTESLLFLFFHAYKHFLGRGTGIRQIMDILLYYKENKCRISMEYFQEVLRICKINNFWLDILHIGNQYLGLCEEKPENICCPEELLQDILCGGVFGGQEKSDFVTASVTLALKKGTQRYEKLYTLFRAAFSTKELLTSAYPYLHEKPWLFPMVWVRRWIRYIQFAGKDVWKISVEVLNKSTKRMEFIKKYEK